MIYPQQFEELYQEELHTFQSYSFLSIFPIRNNPLQLTPKNYQTLYKYLACTLCGELMNRPVYLNCAHRFCKDCIQRHIRSTSNKTCPYCRNNEIMSKNDLKIDDFVIDFANLIFEEVGIVDKEAASQETKEQRQSTLQNSSIEAKVQQSIQQQSTQIVINLSRKRGRPKKTPFIWNQSAQRTEESKKTQEEYQQPQSRKKTLLALSDYTSSCEKIFSNQCLLNNKQPQKKQIKREQSNENAPKQWIKKDHYEQKVSIIKMEYLNHYGKNYFDRLAQTINKDVFIQIRLLPNPQKPFTPSLKCEVILCPHHILAVSIQKFIAAQLNISWKNVRLGVKTNNTLKYINEFLKISKINQKYWVNGDFNAVSLSQMLSSVSFEDHIDSKYILKEPNMDKRTLYFEIQYDKKEYQYKIKKLQS